MHLYCFLDNIKKSCYNYKLPSSGMPARERIKSNHKSISIYIHVQAAIRRGIRSSVLAAWALIVS